MVRLLAFLISFHLAASLQAQLEFTLDRELLKLVDENVLSVSEAEAISSHLLNYGWPQTPNEAWSIKGLSEERCSWLASSSFWADCISRSESKSRTSFRSSADLKRDYDGRYSKDVMVVSQNLGVRVGPGYGGGYLKSSLGPLSFILGDHRRHWGTGLTINRYDPFNSMRYSHELSSPSRSYDGALPTPSSNFVRGAAANLRWNTSWLCVSAGRYNNEEVSCSASLFNTQTIKGGKYSWGVMGELRDSLFVSGLSTRLELNSLNLECEVAHDSEGWKWISRGVITSDLGDFLYWTVDSEMKRLLGIQFGDRVNGFRVEASRGGELRLVAAKKWEFEDDRELELRSRLRFVEGKPCVDLRIGVESEFIDAMAQVQTSIHSPSIQSSLRVIVGSERKMCVAVLNGAMESDQRLYQLLPTSTGYRLFSIGNESRAVVYYELVPSVVRVSVERVWYRREAEEINPLNYSNRVSIRFEWR